MTGNKYVTRLRGTSVADVESVGRKAAVLGELAAAGMDVPDGRVLTVDAFRAVLRLGDVGTAALPDDVASAIDEAFAALGDGPVAVRSSAVDEDLAEMSYAGQYDSVLDVRGREALESAVRTCWQSAFSDRVSAYRAEDQSQDVPRVAVLVQRMVDATAAGVAFSANPVTGDRQEVRINAVQGLADRLVSGHVSPDEWSVRAAADQVAGAEGAIDSTQATRIAELARDIERLFGTPQDIEWAIECDRVWLLQARPITALPEPGVAARPMVVDPPPGHWSRASHTTSPLTPLRRSTVLPTLNETSGYLFSFGMGSRLAFDEIGGWLYSRFVMPEGPAEMAKRLQQVLGEVFQDEPQRRIDLWHGEWRDELTGALRRLRDEVDPAALSDEDLLTHLLAIRAVEDKAMEVHFKLGGVGVLAVGKLGVLCAEQLGWSATRTLDLLNGLPGMTTEPAHRLEELASQARASTAVMEWLEREDVTVSEICAADAWFGVAFDAYLRDFGLRTVGIDIGSPAMAERPALLLALLRGQLDRGFDPSRQAAALAEERSAAEQEARSKVADSDAFDSVLRLAQAVYPLRDDSNYLVQVAGGLFRRGILDVGDRLARRGRISQAEGVLMLVFDEVIDALRRDVDLREVEAIRTGEFLWAQQNPGPTEYGEETKRTPPTELIAKLPPPAREVVSAGLWSMREVAGIRAETAADESAVAHGLAASRGTYTGPVRVIMNEADFGKLRTGDVVVCPETTAEWSVLFPCVGALITDTGGLLSHPAIIAREYRVPAVLATGDGTRRLRDGDMVTVDGDNGTVRRWEGGD
ncbi:PEP/pyruvate-binding domain-containing protein [Amycolatopsis japonica]|uniref:PEP/pyruvate-binding domain-containing protein n=1 Tax=Amycolatopsis japonica TaxID=208439 RepID=UPI00367259A4